MKFYLSSFKFGNKVEDLKRLQSANKKIGHISNARDWLGSDADRVQKNQQNEIDFLNTL